jgi:hypothetical protein
LSENKLKKEPKFFDEPIEFGRPIISKGRIFAFPLKSCIRKSNIKKGNCVSIVWDDVSKIFFGLIIGEESHIFLLDSNSTVEDVGKIEMNDAIGGLLVHDRVDSIYCFIDDEKELKIFEHKLESERKMYSHMWGHFAFAPIEYTGITLKDEKLLEAVKNDFDNSIYLLTSSGNIYSFEINKKDLRLISKIDNKNLSGTLCVNPKNGDVYGIAREGEFWKLSGSEIKYLNVKIPCMKNRNYLARAGKILWFNGKIYGGTIQDGYLFEFDVENNFIKNFGRPDENHEIRSIDILPNGKIFGITSNKESGMGRIFNYSEKLGFEDIGIIQAWQPMHDFAYQPLCIKAGESGEFLIGNGENRENIFLYCSSPF